MLGTAFARTTHYLDFEEMSEAICKLLEGLVADDFAPHTPSDVGLFGDHVNKVVSCTNIGMKYDKADTVCSRLHIVRKRWVVQGEGSGPNNIEPRDDPFVSLIQPESPIEHLNVVTEQLESYNRMLAQLDDNVPFSDRVEKPPSVAKSIRKIYAHLHEAIQKDWDCSCANHHVVNLRLNANTPDTEREALEVDFFFYKGPIPHQWQEGRICVKEDSVS